MSSRILRSIEPAVSSGAFLRSTPHRILYCDRDMACAHQDELFMLLWRDRTTIEGVKILSQHLEQFARERERGLALITIIEQNARMPASGTRESMAKLMRRIGTKFVISGVAFEGDGFMAAGIRGVVTGLTLIAQQPYPHRVWKNVREVGEWFECEAPRIQRLFVGSEVERSVRGFRRAVTELDPGQQRRFGA